MVKRLPGQLVSLVQSLFVFFGSFVALVLISPMTFVIGLGFGLLSLLFSVVASRPMSGYRKEVQELLLRITVKPRNSLSRIGFCDLITHGARRKNLSESK